MIIDAHGHIYEFLAGYGSKGEFRPLGKGKGIWATGEVEQFFPEKYGDLGFHAEPLLGLMDEGGIDHVVLLQGGNYGFHNEYVAETARKWPDRFTAVGTLDPYAFFRDDILNHLLGDLGLKSLKFELSRTWGLTGYHPDLRLDGEVFRPILERADDEGLTIVIDMGPMGSPSFDPDALFPVRDRYPNATFVMTHCFFPKKDGNNPMRLDYMKRLVSDNFHFDIANLTSMGNTVADIRAFLTDAKAAIGAEHMIWGTDVPGVLRTYTYRDLVAIVADSGIFTQDELNLVMAENAKRVYRIP